MADECDRAQITIEQHLEASLRAARGILPPERESASECAECGLQIPSSRQIAVPGCQLCVDCATEFESKRLRGLV
jgi:phage/conjugal plasmid C-4 type zinc finger TraR family protein